jgi:hypothetical protein
LKTKPVIALVLAVLLGSSFYAGYGSFSVHAQSELTLAETINNVVSNIQDWSSPWTVLYGQIFSQTNQSIYDMAILQALNQSDYTDVIFIARFAEINGYTSAIINDSVISALQNIPMCGSLPVTYNSTEEVHGVLGSTSFPAFCLYDRYMINAYRYAQEFGVSGWNITQAFLDFANAYLKMPINSQNGEMLWINPALNFSESYSSRYYDEYAETLDMFLLFAEAGVNATVSYNGQILSPINFADDMWLNIQSLWNGNFYNYNSAEGQLIECEMGNFAQIITEYQNFRGNITDFNRVIQDLEYTLLAENFSSPIWDTTGVVAHYQGADQLRLEETLGNIITLQMLYPYFNNAMQSNFQGMLENGAWQGLINSSLYDNGQFSLVNNVPDNTEQAFFCDDASSLGAMTLFLDGIIPDTGYLAINASNEAYQDYRTCFPTSEWNFNYQNQIIRIPVIAGNLSFIFGTQKATQNFPSNGVYNVQFSSDWNTIISVSKVANINTITLQPVTLKTISRLIQNPIPTETPTPTPSTTGSAPISTPIPLTVNPTATPPIKYTSSTDTLQVLMVLAVIVIAFSIISTIVFKVKKK